MVNTVMVLVGTYVGGGGAAQSAWVTFSFANTQGFEAFIPIVITNPNTNFHSAGAEVTVYRSTDAGATYETDGILAQGFPRPTVASQVQRRDIVLGPGIYLISVMVGGGLTTTYTAEMQTAQLITAYG